MAAAPQGPGPSFAVVIPMFNEEAGAEECVARVCRELERLSQRCRLIAVNDGSRDETGAVLERLAAQEPLLRLVTHGQNQGYGAALRTGVTTAHQDGLAYVLFMDSDLTNSPSDIPRFAAMMAANVDVIKATRYRGGGGMAGVPWRRRCISVLGGLVARTLFRLPLTDCTNGFRAVKTRILIQMRLHERGFPVIVEELYHCVFLAQTFGEIPVILTNRRGDLRTTSFAYGFGIFYQYFKYCVRAFFRIPPGDDGSRVD
jgi:glycosyltransferase involved in cell wall biosynthesis